MSSYTEPKITRPQIALWVTELQGIHWTGSSRKRHTDYISNLLSLSLWHHMCHCGFPVTLNSEYPSLYSLRSWFDFFIFIIFFGTDFVFFFLLASFLRSLLVFWVSPKLPNLRELFLDCRVFWPFSLLITQNDIKPHQIVWHCCFWIYIAQLFPLDLFHCVQG